MWLFNLFFTYFELSKLDSHVTIITQTKFDILKQILHMLNVMSHFIPFSVQSVANLSHNCDESEDKSFCILTLRPQVGMVIFEASHAQSDLPLSSAPSGISQHDVDCEQNG